jgi:lipoteichoic acid synthase
MASTTTVFRTAAGQWVAVAAVAGLAAMSVYRGRLVDQAYGRYTGCLGCLESSVWANDALLLAGFAALLALSRLTRTRLVRYPLAAIAALGAVAYCLDIVVFQLLSHRLLLEDMLHFGADTPVLFTVARPLLAQPAGVLLLAAAVIITASACLAVLAGPASVRRAGAWAALSLLGFGGALSVAQAQYIHNTAFRNLLQVNLEVDASRAYTEAAWRRVRAEPPPALACETGLGQRHSVVVVIVESLSAYHSRLFSGLNDFTPHLDRIAREGTWLSRFHANGYSTEGGLIALLTGRVPVPTAGRFGSTMAFTEVDADFHRALAAKGYQTAFFTTGRLATGQRDRWLAALGIAHAEGSENRFYDGMPRGPFEAASDAALVDRFLQWHAGARAPGPFMATILTVGTHPPYVSAAGERDEPARFRKVDAQVGRLVDALKARRFLDDGLVVIVGDHRAMTPIAAEEQERLGPAAAMRVPAVILGHTGMARGEWAAQTQQTDLIPSLAHLLLDESCRNEWQGRFLGAGARPARYVVHAEPMRRNELGVIEGQGHYTLLLDGDDTRWLVAPPRREDADRLRTQVDRERMARMSEFRPAR